MANDFETTLTRLSEKSRFITERYKVVSRQKDEALREIERLQYELDRRDRQIRQLSTQLDNMKISSALSPTAETVAQTRAIIKGLIAEIDRCIAQLR